MAILSLIFSGFFIDAKLIEPGNFELNTKFEASRLHNSNSLECWNDSTKECTLSELMKEKDIFLQKIEAISFSDLGQLDGVKCRPFRETCCAMRCNLMIPNGQDAPKRLSNHNLIQSQESTR